MNLYANLLWAEQNDGAFFVKAEYQGVPTEEGDKQHAANVALIKKLFPSYQIATNHNSAEWVLQKLKTLHPQMFKYVSTLRNPMFISTGIDVIYGTTDFIRGHDWKGEFFQWDSPLWCGPEMAVMLNALYKELSGIVPRLYYTPILTIKGKKITKSQPIPETFLEPLIAQYGFDAVKQYSLHCLNIHSPTDKLDFDSLSATMEVDFALISKM